MARGRSRSSAAKLMPRADPCAAGLTTTGRPSSAAMIGSASLAPISRNAASLKAWKAGVGMPLARRMCLVSTLSIAWMLASTPEPVYGRPRISSSSCTVPSSPPLPCMAMKTPSGRSSSRRCTNDSSTSRPVTR